MRLLRTDREELVLETFNDERRLPKYAILSHTWLEDTEEVTFNDLNDTGAASRKQGWSKLKFARNQARDDQIDYVWIDTCCIDKTSSTELAEAINSMFRWYKKATVCYVYLHDLAPPPGGVAPRITRNEHILSMDGGVSRRRSSSALADALVTSPFLDIDQQESPRSHQPQAAGARNGHDQFGLQPLLESQEVIQMAPLRSDSSEIASRPGAEAPSSSSYWQDFGECRWFSRGWTLQEMIAPSLVCFYSEDGTEIGRLHDPAMAKMVANITGIHKQALMGSPISSFSIAQKMCWAAGRQTTRLEDRAYSLLGIFDVSLPVLYGEGDRAFLRLQQELIRTYSDQTIFAWSPLSHAGVDDQRASEGIIETSVSEPDDQLWESSHLLAGSPDSFKDCARMIPMESEVPYRTHQVTHREVSFELPLFPVSWSLNPYKPEVMRAILQCCFENDPTRSICLNLVRHQNIPETYYVRGKGPRISIEDLYDIEPKCTKENLVVLLSLERVAKHRRILASDTIICRLEAYSLMPHRHVRLGHAEPEHLWNAKSGCFLLQDTLQTGHAFSASILLHNRLSECVVACLRLHRRARDQPIDVTFGRPPQSNSHMVFAKLTSTAPLVINAPDTINGRMIILTATVMSKLLLRENMTIVKVESVHPIELLFECLGFTIAVLFALALLPAMVLVPLLTVRHVRANAYSQYPGDTGPALDQDEKNGLVSGLVISILAGALATFRGYGRRKWFRLLPLRWRPTSWQVAMPLFISVAGLCLCIAQTVIYNQLIVIPENLFDFSWHSIVIARLLILGFGTIVVIPTMFFSHEGYHRRLIPIVSAIFNISTLVPLWIFRVPALVPWTHIACEQDLLPPGPAAVFASAAMEIGGDHAEVCKIFATLGGLQWSILSLGFYSVALDAIALCQNLLRFFLHDRSFLRYLWDDDDF